MKLFVLLVVNCVAEFRIRMQICSDADRYPTNTVKAAIGGTRALSLQLSNGSEIKVNLPYDVDASLGVIEGTMAGNLDAADSVTFRYKQRDIMCLEMLELESMDGSTSVRVIQDLDPYAWDVTYGELSWTSKTKRKISFWANTCIDDGRALTKTDAFQHACHDIVSFPLKPVDECTAGTHQCDYHAKCIDTKTSYTCQCPEGFHGPGLAITRHSDACTKDVADSVTTISPPKTARPSNKPTNPPKSTKAPTKTGKPTKAPATPPKTEKPTKAPTTTPKTARPQKTPLQPIPKPDKIVNDIYALIKAREPTLVGKFDNYGCAGVGNLTSALKTVGKPVDAVDKALNIRKHCIKCSTSQFGSYASYKFSTKSGTCENDIGTASRAFCECDLEFVNAVSGKNCYNTNYDTSKCKPLKTNSSNHGHGACCQSKTGLFLWYNKELNQCCYGRVASIGSC